MPDQPGAPKPLQPEALREVSGGDVIRGHGGPDTITGSAGDDLVIGGFGHDEVRSGDGQDVVTGDDGRDWLDGGAGDDTLSGGAGADTLIGGTGTNVMAGGEGDDVLVGGTVGWDSDTENYFHWKPGDGNDAVYGSPGRDTLVLEDLGLHHTEVIRLISLASGTSFDGRFEWGPGSGPHASYGFFHLTGYGEGSITIGNERISFAGIERIMLKGMETYGMAPLGPEFVNMPGREADDLPPDQRPAADTIVGGDERNVLAGGPGSDVLMAGGGNDALFGELGFDQLRGGTGDDTLVGGAGNDTVAGGAGNDVVLADEGFDVVLWHPGEGNDTIMGGGGTTGLDGSATLRLEDTGLTLEQILAAMQPAEGATMPYISGEAIIMGGFTGTITIGSEVLQVSNLDRLVLGGYTWMRGR